MNPRLLPIAALTLATLGLTTAPATLRAAGSGLGFTQEANRIVITHSGQPVAAYVFRDPKILRPYFAHLHAPGGVQVTRHHPPKPGEDAVDHDTMHPGVWLAFGDLNGQDFWRNKAELRHERFVEPPAVRDGQLWFVAENALRNAAGDVFGTQVSRATFSALPAGYLLVWEATFKPGQGGLVFGDQEEMGLGVRVATPITEQRGGVIRSSVGGTGAKATWGRTADWCDYSGILGGRRVGVTLLPDPQNFRPSWFHNHDYGLMVANPFGRKAMRQGELSRVEVKPGETFRLRFGVLLHASAPDQEVDLAGAYRQFLAALAAQAATR